MRRSIFVALIVASLVLALAPAGARQFPMITGGGHTQNNNSGGTPSEQTAFGGLVAQATGPADGNGVYLARGEIQVRSAGTDDRKTTAKIHGDVVCIMDRGENIWEVRFQIERAAPAALDALEGGYASVFVRDGGRDDEADENFDPSLAANPECGEADDYEMEPHQGQITVHA